MAIRYGANGKPMPEKKPEALQEVLEVNPNVASPVEATVVDEDEVSWDDLDMEDEEELEEEENEDEDV